MSDAQFSCEPFSAGGIPAQRSGAGISPADAALAGPSIPPDGQDPEAAAGAPGLAQEPDVAQEPDAAPVLPIDPPVLPIDPPVLPIDPRPFGAAPVRLCGRGPQPARRLISPQEAAAANRKL